jgi:iron complex transport system permease protein
MKPQQQDTRSHSLAGAISATLSRPGLCIAGLFVLLATLIVLSLAMGAVKIEPVQVVQILLQRTGLGLPTGFLGGSPIEEQQAMVLWTIRLPRILGAVLVGAALAISGAVLQGVLRNPLADPGILGVSSGAGLGAVSVIFVGPAIALPAALMPWMMSIVAFFGGLGITWLVVLLSRHDGRSAIATMLLAGIALSALCGAGTGMLTSFSSDAQLRSITFWSLGSLGGFGWKMLGILAPCVCIPLFLLLFQGRTLNAMTLGESEAGHLGFDVERFKTFTFITCAILVGASVSMCGSIGFIGLVAPHLIRLWMGPDHRHLLPACALLGAILLVAADLVARTAVVPSELPLGVVTAMLGAPFFLWLLRRQTAQF